MKRKLYSQEDDAAIQGAYEFLVLAFNERRVRNRNKPVVLHSIRTGMHLYELGYPKDIVISGILHDLLEDTDITDNDLALKFGEKVARIVRACSFDSRIKDKKDQYEELFARCLKEGNDAVIVKVADILDNLPYMIDKNSAGDLRDFLRGKIKRYIELAGPVIGHEPVYRELKEQHKILTDKIDADERTDR